MISAPNLPRTVLGVLFLGGLIAASFWILRPFLPAAVWAITIVVATWPVMRRLQVSLWGRRSLAVLAMVVLLLVVFFVPLLIAIGSVVEHADVIAGWPKAIATLTIPLPPEWVATLPLIGPKLDIAWRQFAVSAPEQLAAWLAPYQQTVSRWILGQLGGAGVRLIEFVLTIIIAAILYSTGEGAAAVALRFARRLAGSAGENAVSLAGQAIRGVALGVVVTALVQSILAGAGLAVAGVPLPALLTGLIFVVSLAQIGPFPVVVFASIWLYFKGQVGWAIGLLFWALLVDRLNNVLLPILIKRGADLPLLLVFAGVIGGLLAFGLIGIFIGPVVLAVSYRLLDAWAAGEGDDPAAREEDDEVPAADARRPDVDKAIAG